MSRVDYRGLRHQETDSTSVSLTTPPTIPHLTDVLTTLILERGFALDRLVLSCDVDVKTLPQLGLSDRLITPAGAPFN